MFKGFICASLALCKYRFNTVTWYWWVVK